MKSSNNSNNSNNILVAILFIIILVLMGYILFFNTGNANTTFYTDYSTLQNNISYYLGAEYAKMFGAYEIENIIIGYNPDNIEIRSVDDKSILPIAIKDTYIEKNKVKYYKLSNENIKTILKKDLPSYDGIEWYISPEGQLRIKLTKGEPKWWNTNLDELTIS